MASDRRLPALDFRLSAKRKTISRYPGNAKGIGIENALIKGKGDYQ
jgi:hypothetical protein